MQELNQTNIKNVLEQALFRAKTIKPNNSYPLMTHNIEGEGCNGLADCPVHSKN